MPRQNVIEVRTSEGGTESADRVADVLLLFSRADGALGVSEIARSLGLSKAVVHRILRSLSSRGLLQTLSQSSSYALGPAAIGMGNNAWSQSDFRTVAGPVLRALRDKTRETATLSVLSSHSRIYLDQYESPQEIKMIVEIGVRHPLHSGASSRAILAYLPEAYVDEAVAQLEALHPGFDEAGYRHKLDKVRKDGYAVSQNERNTGAASIAAAFFDKAGNVLGSISSCGPVSRYSSTDLDEHAEKVATAALRITDLLSR
ncbi:MAG: IclR family transcriptional regulator [Pseudarthrobacter sp.]